MKLEKCSRWCLFCWLEQRHRDKMLRRAMKGYVWRRWSDTPEQTDRGPQ